MDNNADRKKQLGKLNIFVEIIGVFPVFVLARSPRSFKAWAWACPLFVFAGFSLMTFFSVIMFALGIILWVAIYTNTPRESWDEYLCKILAEYRPIDEEAFQAMLMKIKEDKLDRQAFVTWIRNEEANIKYQNRPSPEQALLDSRLRKGASGQPE